MATKRELKKIIRNTCAGMALEIISAGDVFEQIDPKDVEQIVYDCALLQMKTLSRLNIAFDRGRADFDNPHDYKTARNSYYHKAYKALMADFGKELEVIVARMNTAMPDDVKKILKEAANG